MESVNTVNSTAMDIPAFLRQLGKSLPRTARLVSGFCGTSIKESLDTDEILEIFKVETQPMVLARDELNRELCIPRMSKTKVEIFPHVCKNEYNTLEELFQDDSPFFRVLEDIPSRYLYAGNTMKVIHKQECNSDFLLCQTTELDNLKVVKLPRKLEGKFQPLLKLQHFFLDEVLNDYQLPLNIRFVSQLSTTDQTDELSLTNLNNVCLVQEFEEDTIFAASFTEEPTLVLFPRTLNIELCCGFTVSLQESVRIKQCRQFVKANTSILRRLDIINKESFYYTLCPVRRRTVENLKPPGMFVVDKCYSAEECDGNVTWKQINTSLSNKSANPKPYGELRGQRSAANSTWSCSLNREIDKDEIQSVSSEKHDTIFLDSKDGEENTSLQRSLDSPEHEVSDVTQDAVTIDKSPFPQFFSRESDLLPQSMEAQELAQRKPKPKPRTLINAPKDRKGLISPVEDQQRGYGVISLNEPISSSTWYTEEQCSNDDDCPALPPKLSIRRAKDSNEKQNSTITNAVQASCSHYINESVHELPPKTKGTKIEVQDIPIENEEENSWGDNGDGCSPTLPPKPLFLAKEGAYENDFWQETSLTHLPPPPLPPRKLLLERDSTVQPYHVTNVAKDWKRIEEECLYSEAKDESKNLGQKNRLPSYTEVLPQSDEADSEYEQMSGITESIPSDDDHPYEEVLDWRQETGLYEHVESPVDRLDSSLVEQDPNSPDPKEPCNTRKIFSGKTKQDPKFSKKEASSGKREQALKSKKKKVSSCRTEQDPKSKRKELSRGKKECDPKSHRGQHSSGSHKTAILDQLRPGETGWISRRREEDFMDFEDIECVLQLQKSLEAATAKLAHLEEKVATTEKNPAALTPESDLTSGTDVGVSQNLEGGNKRGMTATRDFHHPCQDANKARATSEVKLNQGVASSGQFLQQRAEAGRSRSMSVPTNIILESYEYCNTEQDLPCTNSTLHKEQGMKMSEDEDIEVSEALTDRQDSNTPDKEPETSMETAYDHEVDQRLITTNSENDRSGALVDEGVRSDLNNTIFESNEGSADHNRAALTYANQPRHVLDVDDQNEPPPLPPKKQTCEVLSKDFKELL